MTRYRHPVIDVVSKQFKSAIGGLSLAVMTIGKSLSRIPELLDCLVQAALHCVRFLLVGYDVGHVVSDWGGAAVIRLSVPRGDHDEADRTACPQQRRMHELHDVRSSLTAKTSAAIAASMPTPGTSAGPRGLL